MQKLCYVLPRFDPDASTHFYHLYELLQRLSSRVDLRLICAGESRPDLHGSATVIVTRRRWLRALMYLGALSHAYLRGCRTFYAHYHTFSGLWASLLCRAFGGRTYVWSCVRHELYFAPWKLRWPELKRRFGVDIPTLLSLRWAQRVVVCSDYMRNHVIRTFGVRPERVVVFEHWINPARYRPLPEKRAAVRSHHQIPENAPVILYVHTLGEHKGAHRLPHLAQRILDVYPEAQFLVAGDGPYRSQLENELRSAGLDQRVHLLGPVPNRDIPELFAAADVFINPATVEEFGRVILEAMACAVPFVSTDGGGGVLAFTTPTQQEFVTSPDDMDGFVERILKLLASPQERKRLSLNGIAHVRAYTLEEATERFLTLLQDEMAGERSRA